MSGLRVDDRYLLAGVLYDGGPSFEDHLASVEIVVEQIAAAAVEAFRAEAVAAILTTPPPDVFENHERLEGRHHSAQIVRDLDP